MDESPLLNLAHNTASSKLVVELLKLGQLDFHAFSLSYLQHELVSLGSRTSRLVPLPRFIIKRILAKLLPMIEQHRRESFPLGFSSEILSKTE